MVRRTAIIQLPGEVFESGEAILTVQAQSDVDVGRLMMSWLDERTLQFVDCSEGMTLTLGAETMRLEPSRFSSGRWEIRDPAMGYAMTRVRAGNQVTVRCIIPDGRRIAVSGCVIGEYDAAY